MNEMQRKVAEFHRALGEPVRESPGAITIERKRLRVALIAEELEELIWALGGRPELGFTKDVEHLEWPEPIDMTAAIDAVADLLYVTYGGAVELGVDMGPIFDEVHAANMRKIGGPVRPDGKRLKPEDWRSPDVAKRIAEQMRPCREAWAVEQWTGYEEAGRRWIERGLVRTSQNGEPYRVKVFTLRASAIDFAADVLTEQPNVQHVVVPVIVDEGNNFIRRGEARTAPQPEDRPKGTLEIQLGVDPRDGTPGGKAFETPGRFWVERGLIGDPPEPDKDLRTTRLIKISEGFVADSPEEYVLEAVRMAHEILAWRADDQAREDECNQRIYEAELAAESLHGRLRDTEAALRLYVSAFTCLRRSVDGVSVEAKAIYADVRNQTPAGVWREPHYCPTCGSPRRDLRMVWNKGDEDCQDDWHKGEA